MSTLFLIGNGFDINCGMRTRYIDVYEGYVKENSNSENLERFKRTIASDLETWCDFEMAMAEYAQKIENEAEFLECVRDFAKYMEWYLIEEENRFKSKFANEQLITTVAEEMERSLRTFYMDISHNIDSIMERRRATSFVGFEAISFNYTDVFDVFLNFGLKSYGVRKAVTHIHGILQDGPVLGVDNIEQIKANYTLSRKGKRGFIKPIFNNEYDEERVEEAKKKIRSANTICAFGMSLGDSDLSWRNEIIEWLQNDKDNHLFVYQYSCSKLRYATIGEKLDMEDDAKEQLLSEWGISDMDFIYNQIHIPCGKNIFNIHTVVEAEERRLYGSENTDLKGA